MIVCKKSFKTDGFILRQIYVPANLSNNPMPMTGASVQKEFQNRR